MFTANSNTGPLSEYANIPATRGQTLNWCTIAKSSSFKVLQVPRNLFHMAKLYLFNSQVNCFCGFACRRSSQVKEYTVKG